MRKGMSAAVLSALLCAALVGAFCGCGGRSGRNDNVPIASGPSETPGQPVAGPTGRARLTILFPPLRGAKRAAPSGGRVIPDNAQSVLLTVTGDGIPGDRPYTKAVNRPEVPVSDPPREEVEFLLPIGNKVFRAEAKEGADGAGRTLVSASSPAMDLKEGEVQTVTLTLSGQGVISGTVTDPNGSPIDGARVETSDGAAGVRSATSGADGRYRLADVPGGARVVTFSFCGRATDAQVTVVQDVEVTVNASLPVNAGQERPAAPVIALGAPQVNSAVGQATLTGTVTDADDSGAVLIVNSGESRIPVAAEGSFSALAILQPGAETDVPRQLVARTRRTFLPG